MLSEKNSMKLQAHLCVHSARASSVYVIALPLAMPSPVAANLSALFFDTRISRRLLCVRMQAAKLASARALQTERPATNSKGMVDAHTSGWSTDRLHRGMVAMQSPRSQMAYVRLHRPPPRDSRTTSMNRLRLDTYSSTRDIAEVLYTPHRSPVALELLDPKVGLHLI